MGGRDGQRKDRDGKRDRGGGSENPHGGSAAMRGEIPARTFSFSLFYFMLFYLAPFVQVRSTVPFGLIPSVRKQRRGRRFVKFLRPLIARLLAMQRERRAYYQLG